MKRTHLVDIMYRTAQRLIEESGIMVRYLLPLIPRLQLAINWHTFDPCNISACDYYKITIKSLLNHCKYTEHASLLLDDVGRKITQIQNHYLQYLRFLFVEESSMYSFNVLISIMFFARALCSEHQHYRDLEIVCQLELSCLIKTAHGTHWLEKKR